MPTHIGIVALSPEGSAQCYRLLGQRLSGIRDAAQRPLITLHNRPFATYVEALRAGDWTAVGAMLNDSAKILKAAGVDFCILPDNVAHHALAMLSREVPPFINMIELVAEDAARRGCSKVGLIGTRFVTYGSTYQTMLGLKGMHLLVPDEAEADEIDRVIFQEAVFGRVSKLSRTHVADAVARLRDKGCEALVLGSTEASLMVSPEDCPLPILDPLELLADAAAARASAR
ncbi:MAG: amino acid racemase [Phycisphaerales bacterium]|nr:amino acid racemase [Phycisphaerales bacterium]